MTKAVVPSMLLIIEIEIINSQYQAQHNTINITCVNQISNLKKIESMHVIFHFYYVKRKKIYRIGTRSVQPKSNMWGHIIRCNDYTLGSRFISGFPGGWSMNPIRWSQQKFIPRRVIFADTWWNKSTSLIVDD